MVISLLEISAFAFLIATGILVFYYLFFFTRIAFYGRNESHTAGNLPFSIIIGAQNELSQLKANLIPILEQDYKNEEGEVNFEVILISFEASEETHFFLKGMAEKYAHFRYIQISQEIKGIPKQKYALTLGVKGAKYETVILTGVETAPKSEKWLSYMDGAFKEGIEVVLGYNTYRKGKGLLNRIARYENYLEGIFYLSLALAKIPYNGSYKNFACKKGLFFKHASFLSDQRAFPESVTSFVTLAANRHNTAVLLGAQTVTQSQPLRDKQEWQRRRKDRLNALKGIKIGHKILLGGYVVPYLFFYPLFLLGIFYPPLSETLWIVLGGKFLLQFLLWMFISSKMGERDLMYSFFPLELVFWLFYWELSPTFFKKTKRYWI